ncbi:MAG: di-trans,poly-cis-decaprenylcistransferase, partial [Lachnospiraceae bacterium]|nr:di-trans,poly-cis-decaprenylcistransferase [Candidatus Equihabitans merdae]
MANQIKHLGVIMDGNRRWARKHMFTSVMKGHEKGVDAFIDTCKWCQEEGIKYLTVYAFSTENWKRSQEEVSNIFKLMERFFTEEVDTCIERDIRMIIVGDKSRLTPEDMETVRKTEERTAHCKSLICQVAISYGGRDEIVRAVKKYEEAKANGQVEGELTEETFEQFLDTAGTPDVDLVIRTGGNHRLSNFLPWQTTYSEIYFTDTLWPDFSKEEMMKAIDYYNDCQIN